MHPQGATRSFSQDFFRKYFVVSTTLSKLLGPELSSNIYPSVLVLSSFPILQKLCFIKFCLCKLRCFGAGREIDWVTHKGMTGRENMGHEGKFIETMREREERKIERDRDDVWGDGKTGGSLGKFTNAICARDSALQLAFMMHCLWNCSTDLLNIDSLIFQAWPIEITCILISSTHQPTTHEQMRWNDSGFVAGICCPLNILLQCS